MILILIFYLLHELSHQGSFHHILHATGIQFLGITYSRICWNLHHPYRIDPLRVLHYILSKFEVVGEKALCVYYVVDFVPIEALFLASLHELLFKLSIVDIERLVKITFRMQG